jgi:hypothetical protein
MSDVNENVQAEPTGDIDGASAEPMEAPEQGGVADWRDSIPADIRHSVDVESIEDLAKGYVNAQQMIGGSLRIPGKDAGAEDWDKFYDKIEQVDGVVRYDMDDPTTLFRKAGLPEDASGYNVDAPEDFLALAHTAGLNRDQVETMLMYNQMQDEDLQSHQDEMVENAIGGLRQEWGMAFDRKLEEGQRAVAFLENTAPGLAEALEATGAGNHPAMIKVFQALGANLQEGLGFEGSQQGNTGITPYEAKMQIEEIHNNPDHPWHNGDESAVERYLELNRAAIGG